MREAEAKGTNFVGALRSVEALRGPSARQAAIAAARGAAGEALRSNQIVPVGWYPVSWYVELHRAIDQATGGGVALAREIGAVTTTQDFTGIHRALIRLLSPRTVARHTHRLLQMYWRGGTVEVAEPRQDVISLRFAGWQGFEPAVWEDLAGSFEAVLAVVGASATRARVVGASAARADADIEVRFRAEPERPARS